MYLLHELDGIIKTVSDVYQKQTGLPVSWIKSKHMIY